MKSGIEIYVGLIILVIMTLIGVNMIAADVGVMNARDLQAAYVTEIENSDLAESVIEKCKTSAENQGYYLEVKPVQVGESEIAEVSLTYTYKVPLLGVKTTHVITGYAR